MSLPFFPEGNEGEPGEEDAGESDGGYGCECGIACVDFKGVNISLARPYICRLCEVL